jgi:hypothetical protein
MRHNQSFSFLLKKLKLFLKLFLGTSDMVTEGTYYKTIHTRHSLSPPSKRNILIWSARFLPLYLLLPHSSSFISPLHPNYLHAGPSRHTPLLFLPHRPPPTCSPAPTPLSLSVCPEIPPRTPNEARRPAAPPRRPPPSPLPFSAGAPRRPSPPIQPRRRGIPGSSSLHGTGTTGEQEQARTGAGAGTSSQPLRRPPPSSNMAWRCESGGRGGSWPLLLPPHGQRRPPVRQGHVGGPPTSPCTADPAAAHSEQGMASPAAAGQLPASAPGQSSGGRRFLAPAMGCGALAAASSAQVSFSGGPPGAVAGARRTAWRSDWGREVGTREKEARAHVAWDEGSWQLP